MKRVFLLLLSLLVIQVLASGCIGDLVQAAVPDLAGAGNAQAPEGLRGDWYLMTMETGGETIAMIPGTRIDLSVIHPRQLGGTVSCNYYFATYSRTGTVTSGTEGIALRNLISSDDTCTAAVDRRTQYLGILMNVSAYTGNGTHLTLITATGDVLVFGRYTGIITAEAYPTAPPAPEPVEMAYLEDTYCTMDETSETSYHCNGKVRIKSGVYSEVQVIAKFADNNTFGSPVFPMGGSNPVVKSFSIFPTPQYRGRQPEYIVMLDGGMYPVNKHGNFGTAYINPPPTPVYIDLTHYAPNATVNETPTVTRTTEEPRFRGPTPSVSRIEPANGTIRLTQYTLYGQDFQLDPPTKVYLREQGSACQYCGFEADFVDYYGPEMMGFSVDLRGTGAGPGHYDILVTNSELEESYGVLPNGLLIE